MIQFIHTADIHFGMENYGKIDPKTGIHTRLLDFERALNFCIDVALEKKVDFFLFSGDAYKTAHPTPTQQRLLLRCLLRLYEAKTPVILVIGNHDNPLSFGKATALDLFGSLPVDGFHVIEKPRTINLNTKNGPVQIVGMPWPTRNTLALQESHATKSAVQITDYLSNAAASIIQELAWKLDPAIPAVLAGHLTVSSGIFSGSEKRAIYGNDPVLLPSQLAIPPFDYIALGHLHRYQNLNKDGYPAVVYSGSIERVDFGERKEDKGFCLVTIEEKNKTHHEFITTPMRTFIQVEVTLESARDHTEQILAALKKHDLNDAVIKILYHVPQGYKDRVDLKRIELACAHAMYLVGIIPIIKPHIREKRMNLKVDMDYAALLGAYFDTKPELKAKREQLIEKALILYEEVKYGQLSE